MDREMFGVIGALVGNLGSIYYWYRTFKKDEKEYIAFFLCCLLTIAGLLLTSYRILVIAPAFVILLGVVHYALVKIRDRRE